MNHRWNWFTIHRFTIGALNSFNSPYYHIRSKNPAITIWQPCLQIGVVRGRVSTFSATERSCFFSHHLDKRQARCSLWKLENIVKFDQIVLSDNVCALKQDIHCIPLIWVSYIWFFNMQSWLVQNWITYILCYSLLILIMFFGYIFNFTRPKPWPIYPERSVCPKQNLDSVFTCTWSNVLLTADDRWLSSKSPGV